MRKITSVSRHLEVRSALEEQYLLHFNGFYLRPSFHPVTY